MTGRPAGFTFGSGILPEAHKHTEESGRLFCVSKESKHLLSPPLVSAHMAISL